MKLQQVAKDLADRAISAQADGKTAEEARLRRESRDTLKAILDTFPKTKAAAEARELLNK
jgi:hypothetical protein